MLSGNFSPLYYEPVIATNHAKRAGTHLSFLVYRKSLSIFLIRWIYFNLLL